MRCEITERGGGIKKGLEPGLLEFDKQSMENRRGQYKERKKTNIKVGDIEMKQGRCKFDH